MKGDIQALNDNLESTEINDLDSVEGGCDTTSELPHIPQIEVADTAEDEQLHLEPEPASVEPVDAPGRTTINVKGRKDSDTCTGETLQLKWGARSDVGLVRSHNEDSYLVQAPLFCVSDGMGGHAAGEVASRIAVETISKEAPLTPDDVLLGAAVETANLAVIHGAQTGVGKPGMGCTATAIIVHSNLMAVAHVGDSRCYVLHAGKLVRVTHDHSYVEQLVDAGEITADEARIHPDRSIVTRALGSDPDMYADHFLLEVDKGDRIILCSDGLSSMVPDAVIETLSVSSATPQQAADNLVAEALGQGGHDNITVIVVDVTQDTREELHNKVQTRALLKWFGSTLLFLVAAFALSLFLILNNWYVGVNGQNVAIYRGIHTEIMSVKLYSLQENSNVLAENLPQSVQKQLQDGIEVDNLEEAHVAIESYRTQISRDKEKAEKISKDAGTDGNDTSSSKDDHNQDSNNSSDTTSDDTSKDGGGA